MDPPFVYLFWESGAFFLIIILPVSLVDHYTLSKRLLHCARWMLARIHKYAEFVLNKHAYFPANKHSNGSVYFN